MSKRWQSKDSSVLTVGDLKKILNNIPDETPLSLKLESAMEGDVFTFVSLEEDSLWNIFGCDNDPERADAFGSDIKTMRVLNFVSDTTPLSPRDFPSWWEIERNRGR